jgi:hypothetical protein
MGTLLVLGGFVGGYALGVALQPSIDRFFLWLVLGR